VARNAPKRNYSRLHRVGVFVCVVAQPIQDSSAVSITHNGGNPFATSVARSNGTCAVHRVKSPKRLEMVKLIREVSESDCFLNLRYSVRAKMFCDFAKHFGFFQVAQNGDSICVSLYSILQP